MRPDAALARRGGCSTTGAAIVDVGGESTRPGADGVPVDEELRRVVPVLEALAGEPVSIDTSKAEVARRALELGAELVNDVTALRGDPELAGVVADAGAYVCLMHMRGEPRTMQADPAYDDVVSEVKAFLEERLAFAVAQGIREELVCLDPGIGFGKTVEHNFELVRRLDELVAIGRPVLVGFSRKSSLGRIMGDPEATTGTAAASVGAAVAAYDRGATILRVHDVREHVEALRAAQAVAVGGGMKVELRGLELFGHHGVSEEEREARPAVPLRRRARGGRAGRERPDRGRRRLPRGRGDRARGRRRAATSCSRRSPPRSRTTLVERFPVERVEGASPQAGGAPGRHRPRVRGRHGRAPVRPG